MQETTGRAGQNLGGQMILSPLDKRRSIGLAEAARVLGIPPAPCDGTRPKARYPAHFESASEGRIGDSGQMFSNAGSSAKERAEKPEVADNVTTHKPKGASPSRPVASD